MAVDGCGLVCKYILFIFNIIFAVVGIAFFGLGLWMRFSDGTRGFFEIEQLSSSAFVIAAYVLITLGALMLIMVSFGDYGACSEKRCALSVFGCFLGVLAVADIALGVIFHSKSEEVGLRFGEFYTQLYTMYVATGDPVIGVTLTFMHNTFHCCGMTGVVLVEAVKHTCPEPDGFLEHLKMPSCPLLIIESVANKAPVVMGVFIVIGVLLIIAMICASILDRQIKKDQQEFTAHYSTVY